MELCRVNLLDTKAPNFTRENAGEMARRATISRVAREKREREQLKAAIESEKLALASMPQNDDARRARVQKQIDVLLNDMESASSLEKRLQLGSAIERLWKLVQPTAGVLRPNKQSRRSQADAMPIHTPQEPVAIPANIHQKPNVFQPRNDPNEPNG